MVRTESTRNKLAKCKVRFAAWVMPGYRWLGRYMYVYDVRYISICGSLTLFVAVMSAPLSRRKEQVAVWPILAAMCNAVQPSYNNRQR